MTKELKNSGFEWIGEISGTFRTVPLKACFTLKGRVGWKGLKASEFVEEGPYLITGTDFTNDKINWETCAHISEERFQEDENIQIVEDDLLITKDGTIGKVAIALNCPDKVSLNGGVFIARNDRYLKCLSRYFLYIMKSPMLQDWFNLKDTGASTIKHLTQEKFYNFIFPLPDVSMQSTIVSYLDTKCSEIDQQISNQEKVIEELKDYKKSLITEAVTKGLDPNVEMKDSGIEWIGRIPDAWNQTRLKYCFENVSSGSWGKDHGEDEEDLICLRVADFDFPSGSFKNKDIEDYTVRSYPQKKISDLYLKKGDIILEKSGGGEKTPVGRAVLFNMDISATCSNFCAQLHPCSRFINSVYLEYWFRAWYSQGCSRFYINQTTGIQNLNLKSVFSSEIVPVPELEEQSAIVSYLDTKCAQIDHQIEKRKELIEKLKEYKSSLIYETVTGKREVPIDES